MGWSEQQAGAADPQQAKQLSRAVTPKREVNPWPHLGVVWLLMTALYAATTSHSVGLEDDGLFILASHYAGIAHPPGYPLFTLIAHLFTTLPFATIAFKAHLASAVLGAAACSALWWCVWILLPGRIPAYAAALVYGLSVTFWSQSIVAEVYSLNALFFFLVLGICLSIEPNGKKQARLLGVLALIFGLSLTNHWPLMVLASPAFLIILWPSRGMVLRHLPLMIPFFLIGLLPYAWMILRSWSNPPISFYGPINSFADFWFIFSRKGYEGVDSSATAGLYDKLQFTNYFLLQTVKQFTPAGFVLAIIGFVRQGQIWGPRISAALITAFFCSSLLLVGLLGFDYDPVHVAAFRVYPLIAYGVMAVWAGLGVHAVASYVTTRTQQRRLGFVTSASLLAVLVAATFLVGLRNNYRGDFHYPSDFAFSVLESLPPNAVLFANDDIGFGTISYWHLLYEVRPDLSIYQIDGLALSNRLFDPLTATHEDKVVALRRFVTGTERPVFMLGSALPATGYDDFGLYAKLHKDLNAEARAVFDDELFDRYQILMAANHVSDEWLDVHRDYLSHKFGWVLAASSTGGEAQLIERLARYSALTENNLNGLLGVALGIISDTTTLHSAVLLDILQKSERLLDSTVSDRDLGLYLFASGAYFLAVNDYPMAEQMLVNSVETWPDPSNGAMDALLKLREALGSASAAE